ncbi:uncharacterized protein MONBRDRAFT_22868 [Monosiga brevicollis MX1]|uniref:FAD/NAD(P)-binding domain-containing protein n=1 Tax=Monosiga brevicollis TaxID=81824 RepID=A9USB1_MONBE|nr:uncharacterized protein MONBRDRAFT_22868 [Monosiga brevicollis MX1]EDQ91750.1 predicted protein [Monosiga brevicollis MX1]|eukprot:XP_001743036.1 hypothetical protein [Monosiga brevicollis MX1]
MSWSWGPVGVLTASYVRDVDHSKYKVTVVSPRDHMLFTPLLASTTVGTLEHRSIIEPVRPQAAKNGWRYLQAEATNLDLQQQRITCRMSSLHVSGVQKDTVIDYNHLVVAIGAQPHTLNVPGVDESRVFFLKETEHARNIRSHIHDCLEAASNTTLSPEVRRRLTTFCVVGGGPTGVEFAAELSDFLEQDAARLYPELTMLPQVIIFEAGTSILGSFDQALSEYGLMRMKRQHVDIRLQTQVKEVKDQSLVLSTGEEVNTSTIVWSTGVAPRSLVQQLDAKHKSNGSIGVDECLQIQEAQNAYALGDCASLERRLPTVAQVAEQQGAYLARHFNQNFSSAKPFAFASKGMLAYLGSYGGVKLSGFKAWLVWRGGYLTKLGTWRSRLQVPFDWAKTMFFGRDPARF